MINQRTEFQRGALKYAKIINIPQKVNGNFNFYRKQRTDRNVWGLPNGRKLLIHIIHQRKAAVIWDIYGER
jgi:hypothetical protein